MLSTQLGVQAIFEPGEAFILLAGNGDGPSLVARRVSLYFVLERVIVDIVWNSVVRQHDRPQMSQAI